MTFFCFMRMPAVVAKTNEEGEDEGDRKPDERGEPIGGWSGSWIGGAVSREERARPHKGGADCERRVTKRSHLF